MGENEKITPVISQSNEYFYIHKWLKDNYGKAG